MTRLNFCIIAFIVATASIAAVAQVGPVDNRDVGVTVAGLGVKQTFTAAQRGAILTISPSGATYLPNFDAAQNFSMTLVHANCPCTLSNPNTTPVPGQSGNIAIIQSATGSDTIGTWGTSYKFAAGVKPTLSTAANAVDLFPYYVLSNTQIIVGSGVLNAQ